MKILCVDHIGIAADSIDGSANFYTQVLGLEVAGTEEIVEQKVRTAFLPVENPNLRYWSRRPPTAPSPAISPRMVRGYST